MKTINSKEKVVLTASVQELLKRLAIFSVVTFVIMTVVRISYSKDLLSSLSYLTTKKEHIKENSIVFAVLAIIGSYPMLKAPIEDALDFYGYECGFDYIFDEQWKKEEASTVRNRRNQVKQVMVKGTLLALLVICFLDFQFANVACSIFKI